MPSRITIEAREREACEVLAQVDRFPPTTSRTVFYPEETVLAAMFAFADQRASQGERVDDEGGVVVPREPTEAMMDAGGLAINPDDDVLAVTSHEARLAYRAMVEACAPAALSAAPIPSTDREGVVERLAEAAQAVLDNADRPGSRMHFEIGPSGEDIWVDHKEVDQPKLNELANALSALKSRGLGS